MGWSVDRLNWDWVEVEGCSSLLVEGSVDRSYSTSTYYLVLEVKLGIGSGFCGDVQSTSDKIFPLFKLSKSDSINANEN